MDAINSMYSVTYDIDQKHGTQYHTRFTDFVKHMQRENFVVGGAMTDDDHDPEVVGELDAGQLSIPVMEEDTDRRVSPEDRRGGPAGDAEAGGR